MKKAKVVIALVLAVVLFAAGAYAGYSAHNFSFIKEKNEITPIVVKEELIDLADVTTQELAITGVETFTESKQLKGHNLPLTNKKIIVSYDAVIKAATDLSEATVEVAKSDDGKDAINVTLKKCTITDMYIDEDSWQYLETKAGVFNKLKIADDKVLRDTVMKTLKARAKDNDVVGKGNEQAKVVVSEFLAKAYPKAVINVEVK